MTGNISCGDTSVWGDRKEAGRGGGIWGSLNGKLKHRLNICKMETLVQFPPCRVPDMFRVAFCISLYVFWSNKDLNICNLWTQRLQKTASVQNIGPKDQRAGCSLPDKWSKTGSGEVKTPEIEKKWSTLGPLPQNGRDDGWNAKRLRKLVHPSLLTCANFLSLQPIRAPTVPPIQCRKNRSVCSDSWG